MKNKFSSAVWLLAVIQLMITGGCTSSRVFRPKPIRVTGIFSPIDIVKAQPVIQGSYIHIAPGVLHDSAAFAATAVAVYTKHTWVYAHTDSLERCSGFPSLYFEEQKTAIDTMLKKWESKPLTGSSFDRYFRDLVVIRDSGFLDEYIVDQFGGILVMPPGLALDLEAFYGWKKKNNPTVSITGPEYYYLIGFEASWEK